MSTSMQIVLDTLEDDDFPQNQPIKRPVALLDVDDTLIVKGKLNIELLNALKEKGIKDVYLLTDMIMINSSIEERQNLIEALAREGFTCHGVITPADLLWSSISMEEALALDQEIGQNFKGIYEGPRFHAFLEATLNNYPRIKAVFNLDNLLNRPGETFAYASQAPKEDRINNQLKSAVCKLLVDALVEKLMVAQPWMTHNKGLLVQKFFTNMLPWINAVVVADDLSEVVNCMKVINKTAPAPMAFIKIAADGSPQPDNEFMHLDKVMARSPLQNALLKKITAYLDWRADKQLDDGRGYELGFFTRLRHWTNFGEDRARALYSKLVYASPAAVIGIIKAHFSGGHSTLHNHSLDAFLLEAIDKHLDDFDITSLFSLRFSESRAALREKVLAFDPASKQPAVTVKMI